MSELQFQSRLDRLNEAHRVARAALCLVSQRTCEVVSTDIPEIVLLRHCCVGYEVWTFIGVHPILCSLDGSLELLSLLAELELARPLVFCQFFLLFLWFLGSLVFIFLFFLFCII